MHCPNCGLEILEKAKFCPKCGFSLKKNAKMPEKVIVSPNVSVSPTITASGNEEAKVEFSPHVNISPVITIESITNPKIVVRDLETLIERVEEIALLANELKIEDVKDLKGLIARTIFKNRKLLEKYGIDPLDYAKMLVIRYNFKSAGFSDITLTPVAIRSSLDIIEGRVSDPLEAVKVAHKYWSERLGIKVDTKDREEINNRVCKLFELEEPSVPEEKGVERELLEKRISMVESRDLRQLEAKYKKEDLIKILESFRILQRIKGLTNEDHKASEYIEQVNLLKGYTEGFDKNLIEDLDNIIRRIDAELLPDEIVPDKSRSEIRRVCSNEIDVWVAVFLKR